MREDQAKTKWCPMTRFHKGFDNDVYCNGSDCMMWKWEAEIKLDMDHPGSMSIEELPDGYCGLTR
jgi:hypothetical protein